MSWILWDGIHLFRRINGTKLKRMIAFLFLFSLAGSICALFYSSGRIETHRKISTICKDKIGRKFISFCLPQVNYNILGNSEICLPDYQNHTRTALIVYYNFCPSCRILLQNLDKINRIDTLVNTRIIAYSWGNSQDGIHIDDTATYRSTMELIDEYNFSFPFVLNRQDVFESVKRMFPRFPKPAVFFWIVNYRFFTFSVDWVTLKKYDV